MSLEDARAQYDTAEILYPEAYADYSFEDYIAFLESVVLISKSDDSIYITTRGREFLTYLVREGRSLLKRN